MTKVTEPNAGSSCFRSPDSLSAPTTKVSRSVHLASTPRTAFHYEETLCKQIQPYNLRKRKSYEGPDSEKGM